MESSFSDLVLQFTISIKKVKMSPAITFAPMDQLLTIVYHTRAVYFNISIKTLINYGRNFTCGNINCTDIDAF
ncbi:hypothetical protein D3C85_1667890 [compost metagenome]